MIFDDPGKGGSGWAGNHHWGSHLSHRRASSNYLNAGTTRGRADGFTVEAWMLIQVQQ